MSTHHRLCTAGGITAIVGESFGEIFTSNCLAIGMPCLNVSTDGLSRLQDAARAVPRRSFVIDLENKTIIGDDLTVPVELTEGARIQFIEGTWDVTTVLLEADGRDQAHDIEFAVPEQLALTNKPSDGHAAGRRLSAAQCGLENPRCR